MRLMALHERCVGAGLATATIEDAMDSDTPKQALIGLLLDQRPASDKLVAALAEGDAQEREAAYLSIEHTVRAETSLSARDRGGSGGGEKSQAVALAVTCVQPIIEKVLCSPATAEEEARGAATVRDVQAGHHRGGWRDVPQEQRRDSALAHHHDSAGHRLCQDDR